MEGPVELWLKHPDVDGIEVSSFGRVRSVKGYYYKISPNNCGYLKVLFRVNGKVVSKLVHRFVAETFIPNPNNIPQVNHKDGDRKNNSASNLEWCTSSYNIQYREKHGEAKGLPVFAVNLSTLKVSRFCSQHEAGQALGFEQGSISAVIRGKAKRAGDYWFVNDDDNAVDLTKSKLYCVDKTRLTAADEVSADFVSRILAE